MVILSGILPGKFQGERSLVCCSPWGPKSWTWLMGCSHSGVYGFGFRLFLDLASGTPSLLGSLLPHQAFLSPLLVLPPPL